MKIIICWKNNFKKSQISFEYTFCQLLLINLRKLFNKDSHFQWSSFGFNELHLHFKYHVKRIKKCPLAPHNGPSKRIESVPDWKLSHRYWRVNIFFTWRMNIFSLAIMYPCQAWWCLRRTDYMRINIVVIVRWHQGKKGKEAREETEGKSGRMNRGREKIKKKIREGYREDKTLKCRWIFTKVDFRFS